VKRSLIHIARPVLTLVVASACSSGRPPAVMPATGPTSATTASSAAPDPEAFRNARPPAGTLAPHEYPPVEVAQLPNGISLYVVHRPAGVVSLSLVARSHVSRLPAGKSGVSALTLRMMTEGTTRKNSLRLAEAAESLGATLEQSASRDFVRLGLTTLPENVKDGLSLLSEVAQTPSFPASELERVRHEWLDALESERQNPSRVASLVGLRLLLGERTGAPVNGSRKDIAEIGRADLVQFHRSTFVPENLAVIAVGDITLEKLRPLATELFGSLAGKSGDAAPLAPMPPAPDSHTAYLVDRPGAVQTALFVAQPFPRRAEGGHEARELLVNLFGGLFTSRLNSNLREAHAYTYGARASQLATRDWGALALTTSVRTDVTSEALSEAFLELQKIAGEKPALPLKEEEIARARVDLKQELGKSLSDTGEVAANVETLFVQSLAPDYFHKYPTLLDGLGAPVVSAEAKRIAPEHMIVVVVGDRNVIAAPLTARGFKVETVSDKLTD
jgi:zinc protease